MSEGSGGERRERMKEGRYRKEGGRRWGRKRIEGSRASKERERMIK